MAETVSQQQSRVRRRAMGRKLIMGSSQLAVTLVSLADSTDRTFLDKREDAALQKLLDHAYQVVKRLDKLGTRLEGE